MAKSTEEKPKNKGSQRETAVEGNPAEGTTFRELIQSATGSEAPTAEEFESAMAARGYRTSDVRKLKRAFKKVNESGKDYRLQDEGFDVFGEQGQETGSGRAKGNKAGFDVGDLIGLGSDVSLLAGALRNEKSKMEQQQAAQQQKESMVFPEEPSLQHGMPQSLSPETEFATTMRDLLAVTAAASKKGEAGSNQAADGEGNKGEESGQQAGQQAGQNKGKPGMDNFKPGDIFQPDPSVLDFELIPGGGEQEGGQPEGQLPGIDDWKSNLGVGRTGKEEATDTRTKGQRGRDLLTGVDPGNTPGFFDVDAQDFGLEAYGLGEFATEGSQNAMMALGGLGLFKKMKPLAKFANTPIALAGITGTAMKGIGDAINPNEDVNWGELGSDAANIAALWALGKVNTRNTPGASPGQLPGGSRLRKPTKFSASGAGQRMRETANAFKAQIQGRAQQAGQPFNVSPFQRFNIGSPGGAGRTAPELVEMNFLENIADDIARLPIKRRGGVLTKFRAY